jgi:hypothetical protein
VAQLYLTSKYARYYFKVLSSGNLEQRKLAGEAIVKIKAIFQLEKSIASLGRKKKEAVRKKRGRKLVEDYFQWCDDQWAIVQEKTPIYSALLYSRNQREALEAFLKDGRLPAHNNLSELQLRREVVGRKNWLFLGSEEGAQRNTTSSARDSSDQSFGQR